MYEVKRACKVLYVQLEGSLDDSQDRFNRMVGKLALQRDNLFLMFSPPLQLNQAEDMKRFIEQVKEKMGQADVIIIDPIYFAMTGSLSDDLSVRNFTGQLRILQDTFGCAIVLAHHFKKARRDKEGNIMAPDDDDIFGSVFFQAWITHQFLFDIDKVSGTRILQCNVQRSGKIADKINLKMIEPEPLYYKTLEEFPTKGKCLAQFFRENKGRFKAGEVRKVIKMKKTTFYREAKILQAEGLIDRELEGDEYVFFSKL